MKKFYSFFLSFVIILTIALLSLTLINAIPNSWIRENINESAKELSNEGLYPQFGTQFLQLDNFTDALMLTIAYTSDGTSPFIQAMKIPYAHIEDKDNIETLQIVSTSHSIPTTEPSQLEYEYYGRYWNGYLLTLKPLLIFFNYNQIRLINCFFVSLLIILASVGIYKKLPSIYFWLYLLTLAIFYLPIGMFSLQFSSCFIIANLSVIIITWADKIWIEKYSVLFFFIIGILTAFFDFLTFPLVTLCLPLIIYGGLKRNLSLKNLFILSAAWGIGYALFWSSKWLVAISFCDFNFKDDVAGSISQRTTGELPQLMITYFGSSQKFLILASIVSIGVISVCILLSTILIRKYGKFDFINSKLYLALIALYPWVWFLLLINHSIVHLWFTYRAWASTFFCICLLTHFIFSQNVKNSRYDTLLQ
ncbi:MAG: hypothetical protein J1F12_09040 [Muribaculaceae bacterium]|nr:hypothetical protein [Muribaculaceae bacterium]